MFNPGAGAAEPAKGQDVEGKYRILAELGQGGTATVYLAVARGLSGFNKLVVLKTLKKNLMDDMELRKMFLKEARLAARLNHPNIVQTYEAAEDAGLPIIIMEYLDGQPLSRVLSHNRGELPLEMQLRILADALNGLHYAHELADFDGTSLGLVHRDMSPQNVFVTYDGQTKLLDFGIAKLNSSHAETKTGVIKGKLRYMPTEQITADPIDRRADIYAIGVMLWEIATGQPIWKGFSEATIMNRVLCGEIPSPRSVVPSISEELERICVKAMAPDPENRYATAAEFEVEIEGLIDSMGSRVTARATGKVISTMFAEARKKTKSLIETQLSTVGSLSQAEYEARETPSLKMNLDTQPGNTTGIGPIPRPEPPKKSSRAVLIGVSIVGLLGLGVAGQRLLGHPPPPATSTQTVAQTSPVQPEVVKPQALPNMIRVQISATPREAKLFFDNEALPANPLMRSLPADGTRHIVRAELAGYQSANAEVVLDRDLNVDLVLSPLGGAAKSKAYHPPIAPPPVVVRPPTTTPTPKSNCDPPYIVDRDGTKKFKLECL